MKYKLWLHVTESRCFQGYPWHVRAGEDITLIKSNVFPLVHAMSIDFSEQSFQSKSLGSANFALPVGCFHTPTDFSEPAKYSHNLTTLQDSAAFYHFLGPRSTVTKMVFRTHLEKLRCSPIASFYRLGNQDTRLTPLSQAQCQS